MRSLINCPRFQSHIEVPRKMDLDPKCIFLERERNLDVHHPVIKLVASLARNRGVIFRFFPIFGGF